MASELLVAAFALRLVLAVRLGPGRDEAAYWYWAWHGFDASYSLVTVAAIRLSTALLGDGALAMRLPTFLAGTLSVLAAIRLAIRLGASPSAARWAGVALAVAPWQGYVGTVVHPDAFFTLFLLVFAERGVTVLAGLRPPAARGRALLDAAVAAGFLALTKLTGALLLPVVIVLALRQRRHTPRAAAGAIALAVGMGVALVAARDPAMLAGMREFGRFAPGASGAGRALTLLIEILLLGGPAFLVLAVRGVRLARPGAGPPTPHVAGPLTLLAASLLAFHLVFAALGQAKGNWFLAPLALLVPLGVATVKLRRRAVAVLAVASLLVSTALGAGALIAGDGAWRTRLAGSRALAALDATYSTHRGLREADVSPSRRWSERLAEYWTPPRVPRPPGTWRPPRIFATDYGLAFGLAQRWGRDAEVFLPWDRIYVRTCGRPPEPGEDLVFVSRSAKGPPPEIAARFETIEPLPTVTDPNDPRLVVFLCRSWQPGPDPFGPR